MKILFAFGLLCCVLHSPLSAASQPNIVLIFADDLGWKDVGYQGSDFNETPHIDRLAAEGMVFTAGYAGAGNCAPSRACLLSGNYTPRHAVYAVQSTDRGPRQRQRLIPIPNKSGLAQDNLTLADALKLAGYATGIFGKWHLGGRDGAAPEEQGFDTVFESQNGWGASEPDNPKRIFSLTEAACDFMEQNRERPFFVYLSHYAIHTALQARPETLAKFKAKTPGAQTPNGKVLDGESLLPLLKAEGGLRRDSIFWHFPGYLNGPVIRGRELDQRTDFRTRPVSVIHQGDWKLHLYWEEWVLDGGREKLPTNGAVELYNLKEDIGERHNLAASHIAQRDRLLQDLLVWLEATDASIPSQPNPAYAPADKP